MRTCVGRSRRSALFALAIGLALALGQALALALRAFAVQDAVDATIHELGLLLELHARFNDLVDPVLEDIIVVDPLDEVPRRREVTVDVAIPPRDSVEFSALGGVGWRPSFLSHCTSRHRRRRHR